MNFHFINREQELGISEPWDYLDWATIEFDNKKHESKRLRSLYEAPYSFTPGVNSIDMEKLVHTFDAAVTDLGLEFNHHEVEDNLYTSTVQYLYAEASKRQQYFYMMDLRPITELGSGLTELEYADKMVSECGFPPMGPFWTEYSAEDGRQAAHVLFETHPPFLSYNVKTTGENGLAKQFLSFFDDSARFFGNDCYAPWDVEKPYVEYKYFQSKFDHDVGLVVLDNKNIGFLLIVCFYD